jgi:hypothetical protein
MHLDRRSLLLGVAFSALGLAPAAARGQPRVFPHERLGEVWQLMQATIEHGPTGMRAAVEREFGVGVLRFEGQRDWGHTLVLLDTTSIDYLPDSFVMFAADDPLCERGLVPAGVSAKCRIVEPLRNASAGWINGRVFRIP